MWIDIVVFGTDSIYNSSSSKLNIPANTTILIPYNNILSKYNFENMLYNDYPKLNFIFHMLDVDTSGAAETVNIMLRHYNNKNDDRIMSRW